MIKIAGRGKTPVPIPRTKGEVEYLIYPGLEETGVVDHLFSTRIGGVSEGHLESMNLSFSRGDQEERVRENYRRIADVLGCSIGDFVFSHQTHTSNVKVVTDKDRGKGIVRELDYENVDGLITREPGVVLSTFYADCVPVFLVDPINRAIGLCHSGWRGTAERIGEKTIRVMEEELGAKRAHIRAAIGPSICGNCYEISEDLWALFKEEFRQDEDKILVSKGKGKFLLDLWKCNELILIQAGIKRENLEITNICTCCNPDYLFSHRASKGMRGNMGAFLKLKKS